MKTSVVVISMMVLFGCQSKDGDVKQSIAANAKEDLMFAGVDYQVSKGTVTLTGNCPSEELRNKVVARVQSSPGVKKVIDGIIIGPVTLDSDFVLKQKVDSVLASQATVQSQVKGGVVRLSGEVKKSDAEKLLKDIDRLPVSRIENGLTLK
jgi:hyperosmotically inducible protein